MSLHKILYRFLKEPLKIKNPRYIQQRGFAIEEDGDQVPEGMKTMMRFLREDNEEGLFIKSYTNLGFKLSSGMYTIGPCILFPRSVLHWDINKVEDINEQTLSLFSMLEPKLDLLVLGVGDHENISKVNPDVIRYLKSKGINMEITSTTHALATFNFMNSEKRYIAGAFIPPNYIQITEDLQLASDSQQMSLRQLDQPDKDDIVFPETKLFPKTISESVKAARELTQKSVKNFRERNKDIKDKYDQ